MKTIISAKGIGKKYLIGHQKAERYLALRDIITEGAVSAFRGAISPVRKLLRLPTEEARDDSREEFWALRDVNFELGEGERLGIIGRNGAGKSTLLKVLSRITEPTTGRVVINGRVASLLEVGTGFHPELTGRENVYLNGAVLGMTRREIKRKFDEIVAFAEVERFLDTPVKRYSSGMYVRLAFAVAAHLEPEILVVDEVLAVGDLQFQKKCLGKMENVSKQGRTVLFVSHNMEAIERLCSKTIVLKNGSVEAIGNTAEMINKYIQCNPDEIGEQVWEPIKAPGNSITRLNAIRIKNQHGKVATNFDVCEPINIEMEYSVLQDGYALNSVIYFKNEKGQNLLISMDNNDSQWKSTPRPTGRYLSVCQVPGNLLNNGQVSILAAIVENPSPAHVLVDDILRFNVVDSMDPGGVRGNYRDEWPNAAVRPRLSWEVKQIKGGE